MKVVIDARLYGTYHRGIGRYTAQLTSALWNQDSKTQYILLIDPKNPEQPTNYPSNVTLVPAPWSVYTLAEQINLPKLFRKLRADVIHIPHFNVPLFTGRRIVITIHDLIVHHFPAERATTLSPRRYHFKLAAYHLTVRHATRVASRIIVPSEYVKKDVEYFYPATSRKLHVIPLAPATKILTNHRLILPTHYFLIVGAAYPHKNLECALAAFKQVLDFNPQFRLLVVGREDYFMNDFKKQVYQSGLDSYIDFWGEVNDEDLADIYTRATAYLLPSYIEGFGLGAVEAMQYGTPVVAADIPVLHEVLGEAAMFFDPYQHITMAQVMTLIINNKEIVDKLKRYGLEFINKYNWEHTAALTRSLYTEVASLN